jgi:hypothetical protein
MKTFLSGFALALVLTTATVHAGTVFLDDSSGNLFAGDPTTGNYTTVGNSSASVELALGTQSFNGFTDIGFAAGVLYGLDQSGNLFSINTSTAGATLLGNTGLANPAGIVGLSDSTSGVLIAGGQGNIYNINTTVPGSSSVIGGGAYSTAGDDTFLTGNGTGDLWLTSSTPGPTDELYEIDPTTGAIVNDWGALPVANVFGLAYDTDNSILYGFEVGGLQFDVNPTNAPGSGSTVADTGSVAGDSGLLGAAFIASPEPSTFVLIGSALTLLGAGVRRRANRAA